MKKESLKNKSIEENNGKTKSENEVNDKVYDVKKKRLDFRNLKPTDLKNNKRVVLPDLEDDPDEIKRSYLKSELRQVFLNYKHENCDKFGNVIDDKIKDKQLKDIKKLKNRIKNENLACGETDKTGKLTLDTLENIRNKMDKHIKEDKILNDKEARKVENKVNRHMQFWSKILKPGEKFKQEKS